MCFFRNRKEAADYQAKIDSFKATDMEQSAADSLFLPQALANTNALLKANFENGKYFGMSQQFTNDQWFEWEVSRLRDRELWRAKRARLLDMAFDDSALERELGPKDKKKIRQVRFQAAVLNRVKNSGAPRAGQEMNDFLQSEAELLTAEERGRTLLVENDMDAVEEICARLERDWFASPEGLQRKGITKGTNMNHEKYKYSGKMTSLGFKGGEGGSSIGGSSNGNFSIAGKSM